MSETEGTQTGANPTPEPKPEDEKSVTFSWGIVMIRTKRLLKFLDDLARYRIFGDIGWVYLGIILIAGGFMLWLMLDQDYILLTGSLALRCAVGAASAGCMLRAGLTSTPPPALQAYLLLPGLNPYIPFIYGIVGIVVAVVIHEGTLRRYRETASECR